MHSSYNIAALDRSSVIYSFTNLGDFDSGKANPIVVETANGVRVKTADGQERIDGFAGLYCMNIGYGRSEVAEAISRQAHKLAYYHSYADHTTDELAILASPIVYIGFCTTVGNPTTGTPIALPIAPIISQFLKSAVTAIC